MWLMAAGVEGVDASRGPIFSHSIMSKQAAIQGEGVALGRTALIEEELASGQLVRLFDLRMKAAMAYYVVYPARALERPLVRAFRDWLLAEVARRLIALPRLGHRPAIYPTLPTRKDRS